MNRRSRTLLVLSAIAGCTGTPPPVALDGAQTDAATPPSDDGPVWPDAQRDVGLDTLDVRLGDSGDAGDASEGGAMAAADAGDDAGALEGTTCAAATALSGATRVRGERLPPGRAIAPRCLTRAVGAERFYRVTVPPRQLLVATVVPQGVWNPAIRVLADCETLRCLASVDNADDEVEETLGYLNTTDAAQSVVVAVGARSADVRGEFELTVALHPPPVNASCADALRVGDGDVLAGQDISTAHETSSACLTTAPGGQLYYVASIPAGNILVAVVTPRASPWNPVIRLLDGCGAATCVGLANDYLTGDSEALDYRNRGAAAVSVLLTVASNLALTRGAFDLRVQVRPPLANAVCEAAAPMTPGLLISDQWLPLAGDPTPACAAGPPNAQLHYRLSVPAGRAVRVTATPRAPISWLPVVRLRDGCGDSCLAQSPMGFNGDPQSLTWANTGTASREVLVSVGSAVTAPGAFDLIASLEAP